MPLPRLIALFLAAMCIAANPTLSAEPEQKPVQIIAHRGASHDAPENTLAAMKLGFEQGADAGELDVWVTKDGVPVLLHDKDTERTAGVKLLASATNFADLAKLDVGSWKDKKFAGEKIATLVEALATVPSGKRMFVEVKCDAKGVPAILQSIEEAKLKPEQTVIISFDAEVIAAAKKSRPDLVAFWIVSLKNDKQQAPRILDLITKATAIKADGLNLSDSPLIDQVAVEKIRAAKLGLYVWTVDLPEAAQRLVELQVDGITTNRPGWLREKLIP